MDVYRIVKTKNRTADLSGTGAYRTGGRWNNKGTYMLYTSINSSLALLESLVHFDILDIPAQLYIVRLSVNDSAPIFSLPEVSYPKNWMQHELIENKNMGDKWMNDKRFLAIKVRSAVNTSEYNYLLNPLFPGYYDLVKVKDVTEIAVDKRLPITR